MAGSSAGNTWILNALYSKYCDRLGTVDIEPKPPILWTHEANDIVVSDNSAWDLATLGRMGAVPGWPGAEVVPPQPIVAQIRAILEKYQSAGGDVRFEMIEGAGHGPHFDHAEDWNRLFFGFLGEHS